MSERFRAEGPGEISGAFSVLDTQEQNHLPGLYLETQAYALAHDLNRRWENTNGGDRKAAEDVRDRAAAGEG